tara:strand:+ start:4943 stop:5527 length:585 start_codon:yes stop_codon:yes gene_type:complete
MSNKQSWKEMVYPLDKYVDVLLKLNISPIQVLFCQIIYERRHDLLYKIGEEGQIFPKEYLDDLVTKGLVVDTNPSANSKYAEYYEVTEEFSNAFYSVSTTDGDEFWKSYPPYSTIDGKKITLKAVNKEEMVKWYHKHVGSVHDHKKVMAALQFAKDRKLISTRIDKWLQAETFVDLWEMMKETPTEDLPHDRIL